MTGTKRPYSVFEAWAPETTTTTRRPSWLARKGVSIAPPSAPPLPPAVPTIDESSSTTELESAVMERAQPSAPPPAVDLGLAAALAQLAEENATLRAQVTEMAQTMARLRREVLEASEPELVNLAMAIAERVVARELSTDPTLFVRWAREAIQALAAKDEVVIALARDVAQQVPPDAWHGVEVPNRRTIDPQLAPGTIEVRAPEGAVADGGPARLASVAEALGLAQS
jgi:flagellar biosynthesis/type III secretory pathway protein FliH